MSSPKKKKEVFSSKDYDKYYGFNIKIQSNVNRNPDGYFQIIKLIFDSGFTGKVGSEIGIKLRTSNVTSLPEIKTKILFGRLIRYTYLSSNEWFFEKGNTFMEVETPDGAYPNPFETDYLFIPDIHRFFIKKTSKISHSMVEKFLKVAIDQLKNINDIVSVTLIKSKDTYNEIFNSDKLLKLHVEVSYTNDDISGPAKEAMDKLFKEAKSGTADITLLPDNNKQLQKDSTIVKGLLELSEQNGSAKATIEKDNIKKVIRTDHFPEEHLIPKTENLSILDTIRLLFKKF